MHVTWTPLLRSSITVLTASSTVGNEVVATLMGTFGASRTVHSVTMPRVLERCHRGGRDEQRRDKEV